MAKKQQQDALLSMISQMSGGNRKSVGDISIYLKSVNKNTATHMITILDQDNRATSFPYPDGTFTQIQADWNQQDSTKVDYIKNKPNLNIYATLVQLNEERDIRSERDDALLNNINQLNDRVVDIERQEDTWNGKSTVTVSAVGSSTEEIGYITIDGVQKKIVGGSSVQVQSDYAQTDNTQVDFIKNKPDLSVYALATNVYAKSEVYNKTEIDNMIGQIETILARLTTGGGV